MRKIVFTLLLCILYNSAYAQVLPTRKQIKNRKIMLRTFPKNEKPLIILDGKDDISALEFVECPDVSYYYEDTVSVSKDMLHGVEHNKRNRVIKVFTNEYVDSVQLKGYRDNARLFRENEFNCFFGNTRPIIVCGDRTITESEYFDIPDYSIAFVNFYLNPYVRKSYSPEGENGIVFVQLRKTKAAYKGNNSMALPVNGRNYNHMYSQGCVPAFSKESSTGDIQIYLSGAIKKYSSETDGINAVVYMSCAVDTKGKITPILPEWIDGIDVLNERQTEAIIKISREIVSNMPLWEPGVALFYDYQNGKVVEDIREFSVSIPIVFGNMKSSRR